MAWGFMIQNGIDHCVVRSDSLEKNMETMASLEEINEYHNSTLFRFRRNNLIDQKN